jgi:hypothetical protein
MKELILQLQAKLAELKALQASDPTINTAFTQAEIDQLIKIEAFAKPRLAALQAHEAKKQTPKTETPVGLPDPKAVKTETPVGLPDPKAVKTETPVGLPDPKAVKTETPKEDTDLEDFLKPEEEEEGDNVTHTVQTADFQEISETLEKNDAPKEIVEAIKEIPTVTGKITENGAEVKIAKGDNSLEVGFETNDDGSLKTAKVEVETKDLIFGLEKTEDGGSGKIGGKVTDAEGSEITAVVNVGVDLKKGEATLGGSYSKEKLDGSKLELEGELKVSKEGVAIKGSKMETDADGNKNGVEGEVEITKDKVKVGFGLGTENEDKGTHTEIGGSLELAKNKAVLELKGKHKFPVLPKKEFRFPLASAGVATLYGLFSVKVDAEAEVKVGAKIESDDKKGLDAMAKLVATAKASIEGTAGLSLTILELVEGKVELFLKAAFEATAELAFQLGQAKSRALAALHDVKGALVGGIRLTVGAAPGIKAIYESLGGSGSSLEYSYDLASLELLTFTAPSYHSGKGWDTSTWGFGKGKDVIAIENKFAWVGDIVNATVGALKAIAEFIGNVLSAIGDFLVSVGKKLIEWGCAAIDGIAALFSSSARREQEARAHRDTTFKKIVETAIKAVKKKPKMVDRLMKIDNVAFRQVELERIVMEDALVKQAWRNIYETQDMKAASDTMKQLSADVKEFRLVATTPKTEVGSTAKFDFILNSTSAFPVDGMRIDVKCNNKRVVMFPIKGLVETGLTKRSYIIQLPNTNSDSLKGIDLAKAKWTACAVLDLPGGLKDQFSPEISFTVTVPLKPVAQVVDIKSTNTGSPIGDIKLLGANMFILSYGDPKAVKARLSVDISPDSYLTDKMLAWANISLDIRCGGTIISSVKLDRALRRGIVNIIDVNNLFLPKRNTFFEIAKDGLGIFDMMTSMKADMGFASAAETAEISAKLRKTPITLNLTLYGYTIMTKPIIVAVV